jgi:hypothetical protein
MKDYRAHRIVGTAALAAAAITCLVTASSRALSQTTPTARTGKKAQTKNSNEVKYDLITGAECQIRAHSYTQDADANLSAESVQLLCDGQPVPLVDGKLRLDGNGDQKSGWLATADFGKIKIQQQPFWPTPLVYVTSDQNRKIRAFLAPKSDLPSASRNGDLARVQSLLAARANPDAKDAKGDTALILASQSRRLDVVRALLAAGANVNATGQLERTPLIALLESCSAETFEVVQVLLSAKADVNFVAAADQKATALLAASRCNDPQVVRALLATGADVNAAKSDGSTALMDASFFGNLGVVRALLAAGANASVKDGRGHTAEMLASERLTQDKEKDLKNAHQEIVRILHNAAPPQEKK